MEGTLPNFENILKTFQEIQEKVDSLKKEREELLSELDRIKAEKENLIKENEELKNKIAEKDELIHKIEGMIGILNEKLNFGQMEENPENTNNTEGQNQF